MFNLLGFVASILLLCVGIMIAIEYLKKLSFILKIEKWFSSKTTKVSFYQILTFLLSIVLLVILNWFNAVDLTFIPVILNSLLITFSANGVYTWYLKIFNKLQAL